MAYEEFTGVESRLRSQADKQRQAAKRLLDQKFSGGRLRSGAAFLAEQDVNKEVGAGLSEQIGGLQSQKQQQIREERLGEEGRAYAKSEREAAQEFGRKQRLGSQEFAATESALARALQSDQFEKQLAFQEREFAENIKNNLLNKIVSFSKANQRGLDFVLESLGFGTPAEYVPGKPGVLVRRGEENARFRIKDINIRGTGAV